MIDQIKTFPLAGESLLAKINREQKELHNDIRMMLSGMVDANSKPFYCTAAQVKLRLEPYADD